MNDRTLSQTPCISLHGLRWSSIRLLSLPRDVIVLDGGGVTHWTSCRLIAGLMHRDKQPFTAKVKRESPICFFSHCVSGTVGDSSHKLGSNIQTGHRDSTLVRVYKLGRESIHPRSTLLQDVNICPYHTRCITLHTSGQTWTAPAIWYWQAMVSWPNFVLFVNLFLVGFI